MKIKIKDIIYDAEIEPLIIALSEDDKRNIINMSPDCNLYCAYPEDMESDEILEMLKTTKAELTKELVNAT
jgi:hypothetical protein